MLWGYNEKEYSGFSLRTKNILFRLVTQKNTNMSKGVNMVDVPL
jgi:hypothetical protein